MSKFQTTNSTLFNNKNNTVMPDWMESLSENISYTSKPSMNIEFDKRGSFADALNINRTECTAEPREVVASFNKDKAIIDSKIELSKFLKGKYYKTTAKVIDNTILMETTIDGVQADFIFPYEYKNNKICMGSSIKINGEEYPFSDAGFNEALSDIKTGNLKKSQTKIASSRETFIINREEIVRRFNGELRKATDAINSKLNEGLMVGAGSNCYASYYNTDDLFPQVEKEIPQLPDGSFEFVDNNEHVATNEYKSARKLSISAGKVIAKYFPDYIIKNCDRNNSQLVVKAMVLDSRTNIRHSLDFYFDIVNEDVKSIKQAVDTSINKSYTINGLLDEMKNVVNETSNQYHRTQVASNHIHNGSILTKRDVINKLSGIIDLNHIDDIMSDWVNIGAVNQIGIDKYSTKYSFEELLNSVEVETLSQEEKDKMAALKKSFGEGMDLNRIEQEDTGIRDTDDIELSNEMKLSIINNEISKRFNNFQITSHINNITNITFMKDGIRQAIKLHSKFNNRKLENIYAEINGKQVSLNNLAKAFTVNPLLKEYIQNGNVNNFTTTIVASESNLINRLSQIVSNPENIFNVWKQKYLTNVGMGLYTSKYSFEELLNKTAALPLSEKDKMEILEAKKHFTFVVERQDQEDTGVRDMDDNVTNETLLYAANNFLSKHIANYTPKHFKSNLNSAVYTVDLFDDSTGLKSSVDFMFKFSNNTVSDCNVKLNDNIISLNNIKTVFAMNESLSKYLQTNGSKKFDAPMVMTKSDLLRRMSKITNCDSDEIDSIISNWQKQGKIQMLSSDTYASKNSLEQLISVSNIKPLSDEEISIRLEKSRRDKLFNITSNHIQDNDTRRPEVVLSSEQMATHARIEIGAMFADFDILNAAMDNDDYIITAKIVNPVNGLRQTLQFKFNTYNGNKIGNIEKVSDGRKTVGIKDILTLLETKNNAVNKFVQNNKISNKNHKSIITKSELKSKLLTLTTLSMCDNIINDLVSHNIIVPIEMEKYASEYSFTDLVEYLSNNDKLDLINAEKNINEYNKDRVVCTNVPTVMDTGNRTIEKPEQKLSPELIATVAKLKKIVLDANNNKKITNNKFAMFTEKLDECKNANEIEKIWRDIKVYL